MLCDWEMWYVVVIRKHNISKKLLNELAQIIRRGDKRWYRKKKKKMIENHQNSNYASPISLKRFQQDKSNDTKKRSPIIIKMDHTRCPKISDQLQWGERIEKKRPQRHIKALISTQPVPSERC